MKIIQLRNIGLNLHITYIFFFMNTLITRLIWVGLVWSGLVWSGGGGWSAYLLLKICNCIENNPQIFIGLGRDHMNEGMIQWPRIFGQGGGH